MWARKWHLGLSLGVSLLSQLHSLAEALTHIHTARECTRCQRDARGACTPSHFLPTAFCAAFVTLASLGSFFTTPFTMPTATVWRMSRTAKRPRGG